MGGCGRSRFARFRPRQLRRRVAAAAYDGDEHLERAQPLSGDAGRARAPSGCCYSWPHSLCRLRSRDGEAHRPPPQHAAPTSRFFCTRDSTGTGRFRPSRVTGLVCGTCILVTSRAGARPVRRRLAVDAAVVSSALLALPFAAAGIGNHALSEAAHAEQTGSPAAAARLARVAAAWQPWSAEPERMLGVDLPRERRHVAGGAQLCARRPARSARPRRAGTGSRGRATVKRRRERSPSSSASIHSSCASSSGG